MKAALLASLIGSVAEKVPILSDTIHKDLYHQLVLGGWPKVQVTWPSGTPQFEALH